MASGVTVTFISSIKPEFTQAFIAKIGDMTSTIKSKVGFRSIHLLPGDADKNQLLLLQEWDSAKDYYAYTDAMREQGVMAAFGPMFAAPPVTTVWDMPSLVTAK